MIIFDIFIIGRIMEDILLFSYEFGKFFSDY